MPAVQLVASPVTPASATSLAQSKGPPWHASPVASGLPTPVQKLVMPMGDRFQLSVPLKGAKLNQPDAISKSSPTVLIP